MNRAGKNLKGTITVRLIWTRLNTNCFEDVKLVHTGFDSSVICSDVFVTVKDWANNDQVSSLVVLLLDGMPHATLN